MHCSTSLEKVAATEIIHPSLELTMEEEIPGLHSLVDASFGIGLLRMILPVFMTMAAKAAQQMTMGLYLLSLYVLLQVFRPHQVHLCYLHLYRH